MVDLGRLRADADRQLAKRNYARAERLYRELVRRSPKDAQLHVRHAELLRRVKEPRLAARTYRTAAELFWAIGLEARARAAWSMARQLDPTLACPVPERSQAAALLRARLLTGADEPGLELEPPEPHPVIIPPPPPPTPPQDLMPEEEFETLYSGVFDRAS